MSFFASLQAKRRSVVVLGDGILSRGTAAERYLCLNSVQEAIDFDKAAP